MWHDQPVGGERSPWAGGGAEPAGPPFVSGSGATGADPRARACGLLLGWAAVGAVPEGARLPAAARLQLAEVPLEGAPPWLGIDRALAGWWGWRLAAGPVLVADAGTVLSFTRVDRAGRFAGGRLLAGVALQLRAMGGGTAHLPAFEAPALPAEPAPPWPHDTASAMHSGVLRGLAAAIAAAVLEARREEPNCRLLLTGGDGGALGSLLDPALAVEHRPHLCLEALAALRPAGDQPRPRSERI